MTFIFFLFYFLHNYINFLLVFFFFIFYITINISWLGGYLISDSYIFILLSFISLFILCLVLISELNYVLIVLSQILVLICVFFFFSSNLISLYIFFELSLFPIIIIILGYGSQIEKINSSYYLIFYASFCSFPFLFVYLNYSNFLILPYFDKYFS